LNLGWCYLIQSKLPAAMAAFQLASQRLSDSPERATAFFKLADLQLQQKDFTNALSNYSTVLTRFSNLPEVQTNLFEPALYQLLQAGLAARDVGAVTNDVQRILAWFH